MKVYLLQAKLGREWLTCYRFNRRETAQEQLAVMNREYNRRHRIKEQK